MPLRKQGTIVKSGVVLAAAIGFAALPATASAGIFSAFAPKPTATPAPTATPKPVATPSPVATPAPTATPRPTISMAPTTSTSTSGSGTTTASSAGITTVADASATTTTSSAVPAGAACTQLPTTKAFAKVDGDQSDYSPAPGGGFENGTAGWTLSNGAKIVSGNETLGVSPGSHALQLPLSASATSPAFCVDESNPNFRFTYKVDNAVLSGFIAYVLYRDAAGNVTNVQLLSSKTLAMAPSTWQASPKSPLATLIPLNSVAKTASVQLKITSLNPTDFVLDATGAVIGVNPATQAVHDVGSMGSNLVASITGAVSPALNIGVTIDSVEVDPYRRG